MRWIPPLHAALSHLVPDVPSCFSVNTSPARRLRCLSITPPTPTSRSTPAARRAQFSRRRRRRPPRSSSDACTRGCRRRAAAASAQKMPSLTFIAKLERKEEETRLDLAHRDRILQSAPRRRRGRRGDGRHRVVAVRPRLPAVARRQQLDGAARGRTRKRRSSRSATYAKDSMMIRRRCEQQPPAAGGGRTARGSVGPRRQGA